MSCINSTKNIRMLEKLGNGIRAHDNLLRKLAQVGIAFPSAARDSPRPMWFVLVDGDQIAEIWPM